MALLDRLREAQQTGTQPPNPALPRPGPLSPPAAVRPPAPPSVNTGAPGRPATAAPPPTAPLGPLGAAGPRPQTSTAAPAPATTTAFPTSAAPSGPLASAVVQRDRVPTRSELDLMAPGAQVRTPYGVVDRDENGDPRLIVDPAAQPAYEMAWARARKAYGPGLFDDDPRAPRLELRIGSSNFNPLTGQWSRVM